MLMGNISHNLNSHLNFKFLAETNEKVSDLLFSVKSLLRSLSLPILSFFDKVEISSKNIFLLFVQTISFPQQLQQLNLAPVSLLTETESMEIDHIEAGFSLSPGQIYFNNSPC